MGPWTPDQGPQPDVGVVRQAFPGLLFEALLVRPLVTAHGQPAHTAAHTEEDEGREYQGGNVNFKNIHLKSSDEFDLLEGRESLHFVGALRNWLLAKMNPASKASNFAVPGLYRFIAV